MHSLMTMTVAVTMIAAHPSTATVSRRERPVGKRGSQRPALLQIRRGRKQRAKGWAVERTSLFEELQRSMSSRNGRVVDADSGRARGK